MTGKIADKDYFLDAEGNIAADEESAHTLLIREGQEMSSEVAEKIQQVARQTGTAAVEESAVADDAKAAAPSANKKAAPSKNKGAK